MSSVEAPQESPSLHIDALLSQQGPVSVYLAHAGQASYLFYFYAKPSDTAVQWLSDVLEKRSGIEQEHLPLVIPHGLLEEGGWGWSVELSPGMSLREIWDNEPHNPLRSIRLVMQAVDAVAALHANGAVHGDIRAQNIWVGWNSEEGERSTLLGEQLGLWSASEKWDSADMSLDVAECLSPEAAAGSLPSPKSDVYALGVMLFRALHGHVPFPVESAWEMAALQATSELQRPEVNPSVHDDLWSVVESCLHKNASERIDVFELQNRLLPFVRYQKPIFVDLELTDPDSIAEPSPPPIAEEPVPLKSNKKWTPIAPRPLQDLAFVPARKSSEPTGEISRVREEQNLADSESTAHRVTVEEMEVTQEHTLKVDRGGKANPLGHVLSETSAQTDADVTVQAVASSADVLNPIQVLVGARPMAATTGPLYRNSSKIEETDATNKLASVSWLEESSERVIEAPVEFHVTASHDAVKRSSAGPKKRKRTHSKTRSNTGKIAAPSQRSNSAISEQTQFVIFMTLSSVITVLLLKIAERMF